MSRSPVAWCGGTECACLSWEFVSQSVHVLSEEFDIPHLRGLHFQFCFDDSWHCWERRIDGLFDQDFP